MARRTFTMDFTRLDEAETDVTVAYHFQPGRPAYTPRGEYAPIDPPEGPEVEIVGAWLAAGGDRIATRIAVKLTDAEEERFCEVILEIHEDNDCPDYD